MKLGSIYSIALNIASDNIAGRFVEKVVCGDIFEYGLFHEAYSHNAIHTAVR